MRFSREQNIVLITFLPHDNWNPTRVEMAWKWVVYRENVVNFTEEFIFPQKHLKGTYTVRKKMTFLKRNSYSEKKD